MFWVYLENYLIFRAKAHFFEITMKNSITRKLSTFWANADFCAHYDKIVFLTITRKLPTFLFFCDHHEKIVFGHISKTMNISDKSTFFWDRHEKRQLSTFQANNHYKKMFFWPYLENYQYFGQNYVFHISKVINISGKKSS